METMKWPVGFKPDANSGSDDGQHADERGQERRTRDNTYAAAKSTNFRDDHAHAEGSQSIKADKESVFVEWRSYEGTIAHEELQMALDARREQICRLFRHEPKENSHYVMQCLGFILCDKKTMGLVFRVPSTSVGPPISLNEMLRTDFESASAVAPDLEDRIRLAKRLSMALYQLQCAGWLHRKISSHNVIFFPIAHPKNERENTFDFSQPFLTAWQTARCDDQVFRQQTEGTYPWRKNPFLPQELPYIHPSRLAAMLRFKRSFDVYAMGIVLAEIAFWEPIDAINGGNWKDIFTEGREDLNKVELETWNKMVVSICKTELAGEVGGHYKLAVMWCLEGITAWHAQQAAARRNAIEEDFDHEVGLEKAFFWNVLNQFDFMTEAQA
ncbi:MAG: hypothetical protein LQ342_007664 [Letrouitia transgressa]|nr:MAG: hypothetical protein LQ342_007664 [Letrouitia transgressa]